MQPTFRRLRLLGTSAALTLACCAPCLGQQASPARAPSITTVTPEVESPRPFGYVLGDRIIQRIALDLDGKALEPAELPAPERTGNWLERRDARIERDNAGKRWLVLDYQIINVPDELRTIDLPALDLATTSANVRIETQASPLTVAPITPAVVLARAGLEEMRPDEAPPRIDTASLERRLNLSLVVAAVAASLWLGMLALRQWRARTRLPFSRARADMRRLDAGSSAVWQRLHRALDDTAGHVVRGYNLPSLLLRAPWLAPMEADLRQFFDASQSRFFANQPTDGIEPVALCARAAKLERQALA